MPRRRTRSTRAKVDMQVSASEPEMDVEEEDPAEEEPEVVVDDDDADDLSDNKEDELEDDEQAEASDVDVSTAGPSRAAPRLRIKLKLPAQGSEASSLVGTPDASTRRRILTRGSDVESEDEDEDEDDSSTRSDSVAAAPGRPLTARQAVLRNVVDPSHVSLIEPPNPRKKKPLTELEMALKREETARKRKNLSEKKLEDEKVETINRLLKKQSRAKGKRNALATAEDRQAPDSAGANGQDVEMGDGFDESSSQTPTPPTMYRWISTIKRPVVEVPAGSEVNDGSEGPRLVLTFSVPLAALPANDSAPQNIVSSSPVQSRQCDFEGCTAQCKYRLVKDWQRGACGMPHLKALEAQFTTVD